jgi:hypothetical protein
VDLSGQYVDGARSQRCTKRDQSTGDQRRRRNAISRVAPWEDDDRRHHGPLITRVGTVRGMCTVYTETTLTARQAGTGGAEHGGLAINRESRTTGCSGTLVTRRASIICSDGSSSRGTLSLCCAISCSARGRHHRRSPNRAWLRRSVSASASTCPPPPWPLLSGR